MMNKEKGLTRVLKKYLKVMSDIEDSKGFIRVKDISLKTGVSMSSISSAMKKLNKMEYIIYEKYDIIRFTFKGRALVDRINYSFNVIYRFLVDVLKMTPESALNQAQEFSLDADPEFISKLEKFLSSQILNM